MEPFIDPMDKRGLVVEFLGLPGVGKSTLAAEVASALQKEGVPVRFEDLRRVPWLLKRLRSSRDILGLTLRKPRYVYLSGRSIRASKQRSPYDLLKVMHNWLNVTARAERVRPAPTVTLVDQGLFQALWSVSYNSQEREAAKFVRRLSALMPQPDLLILLEAEIPTVARRLRDRGESASRLDPQRNAAFEPELARASRLLEGIVKLTKGAPSDLEIVTITNRDGALQTSVEQAVQAIRRVVYKPGSQISGIL